MFKPGGARPRPQHWQGLLRRGRAGTLLAALLLGCLLRHAGGASSTDADQLRAFKNSLSNPSIPVLATWPEEGGDPCSGWAGVVCDSAGNVVELNLGSAKIAGSLPTSGWVLPSTLAKLNFSDNGIEGRIPPDWQLPPGLQLLDMQRNKLSGNIPPDLSLPDSLLELNLNDNNLDGTIPGKWRLPPKLTTLRLGYNYFTRVPPSWSNHTSLQLLDLTWNDIRGTVPVQALPPSLLHLRLTLNKLSGSVPTSGLPSGLLSLWLANNTLTGSVPEAWEMPPGLVNFRIEFNQLNGTVPLSWAANKTGAAVYLFNNNLAGTLPAWPNAQTNSIVVTPGNQFCGEVPASPSYNESEAVQLRFSGYTISTRPLTQLPSCAGSAGSSPQAQASPPQAQPASNASQAELLLAFKASFRNGATQLSSWEGDNPCAGWVGITCDTQGTVFILKLSRGLQGSIGKGWALPDTLLELSLSRNALTGTVPAGWKLPAALTDLDLQFNQLSGQLPDAWELPQGLDHMYLGKNNFSGTLPAWRLPEMISELGLDNNALTGSLWPQDWVPPRRLANVYLFNNSLTGSLPAYSNAGSVVFGVRPGNVGLCGEVPSSPQYWWYESPEYGPQGPAGAAGRLDPSTLQACTTQASPAPAPLPSPEPLSPPLDSSGSNTAVIAGAVAGAVGGAVLAFGLALWCQRRRRRQRSLGSKASKDLSAQDSFEKGSLEDGEGAKPMDSATEQAAPDAAPPLDDPLLNVLLSKLGADGLASSLLLSSTRGVADDESPGGSMPTSPQQPQPLPGVMIDPKAWAVSFHDLNLERPIGEGSFGRVYLGRWHQTEVAVKVLLNTGIGLESAAELALSLSNPVLHNLQAEASLMAALRHPNIVSFLGVCPLPPCVVTEFCSRGSLLDVLRAARATPARAAQLDWSRRLHMAMDAAKGMLYLHSRVPPIMHRDLKSPNLLVDKHWRVKVCDFNLSKIMEVDAQVASSMAASNPRWLAPEILGGHGATFASDVFSFGVVLWELLCWEVPWGTSNQFAVIKTVSRGGRLPIPAAEELPDGGGGFAGLGAYIELIQACWAQDPAERPDFEAVITKLRQLAGVASKKGSRQAEALAPDEGGNSSGRLPLEWERFLKEEGMPQSNGS